ncbi:DUF4333 domain-containing protein [Haloechinothrix sp. YIM 98757]|uniref:DUF4333 domain-containing protein n=1 Tax=Haloechinothrix aidingensis TaxID=2752311 RepID=A0A838A8N4_9PSEU|nr:DUF4333 domain-containing protein [Haloechinothrix aidingensis]MBA0124762.1 DUF4333 domain-containing protein [Haloechinothrix aidingensis]
MSFPPNEPRPQWTHPPGTPGGHTFQYDTYGGFGVFAQATSTLPSGKKKRALVGGAITVVFAGSALGAWLLGAFQGDVLSTTSLERGVIDMLTDSYGEHDVSKAQCPANQQIDPGHTFACTVEVAGEERSVEIRVLNDKPEFEVGAPE